MMSIKEKRSKIRELIAHLCVGLSILFKGIDKFEHPGKELSASFLVLAGVVILAGSLLHQKLEPRMGKFKIYIFCIESLVMAVLGYTYMVGGSHLMFYFYYLVSILFVVAALFHLNNLKSKEKNQKMKSANPESPSAGEDNSIASQEEKN
jgi:hypothetical protein